MKALGIGEHLLVVLRAKQKDDLLATLLDSGYRPVQFVQSTEIAKKITRELAEIDLRERQSTLGARDDSGGGSRVKINYGSHWTRRGKNCLPISPFAARPALAMPAQLAKTAESK